MSDIPERDEIDSEYKWTLESIYEDWSAWREDYEWIRDQVGTLQSFEGNILESPSTFLEVLQTRDAVMRRLSMLVSYARMRSHEDTSDETASARTAEAKSLASRVNSAVSYLEPEIQRADREAIEDALASEPALQEYEHYLDDIHRMAPHTRSSEVEEVLASLGDVLDAPGEVYRMLSNADLEFPSVEDSSGESVALSLSNFTKLQKRPDRDFRRRVYETFYDEWAKMTHTTATAFEKSVRTDVRLAETRGYNSAREASLDAPNVPLEVYDTLIETVEDNLSLLHRHASLKATRIGVDELAMWDLYVPLAREDQPTIPYEEAVEHVVEAVGPLGSAYQDRVAAGLESGWVDVYETENKQSGAYSGGTYDTQPFILMNYQDNIESMFTLAHEIGHSMHSELRHEAQPYVYGSTSIFLAEIASTVNEALLTIHLLETLEDPIARRHVLDQALERIRATLFRQTMFADFEKQTHRRIEDGEALPPSAIDEIYRDLKAQYYEPAAIDDRIAREWMRIPHFYRSFYVFQYATGISAALSIVDQIEAEGEAAASRYRSFLEAGSSDYPLALLEDIGVDMTESDTIEAALSTYDSHLDAIEASLPAGD